MTGPAQVQLPTPKDILIPLWDRKRQVRQNYSLRAFARDLDVSAGFLSQVFSGKKIPSLQLARKIRQPLDMSKQDYSLLMKSIAFHSPNGGKAREVLTDLLARDLSAQGYAAHESKPLPDLLQMKSWIHFAFLDLTTVAGFRDDDRWIARRLGIPVSALRTVIQDLVALGLIRRENGLWQKTSKKIHFTTDRSHEGTRHYHRQMIGRSLEVMTASSTAAETARRRITGATLAVNPEHLELAVKRLNECLYEITEILGQGPCREVYQLNLQLVPLTHSDESDSE